jgi:hypothetical protein
MQVHSTLTKKAAVVLVTLFSLAACADRQAGITSNAARDDATAAPPDHTTLLSKEMAYGDLRRKVTADGWLPVPDPDCKVNVGGEANVCDDLTELESCSGDGFCVMRFARNGEKLEVYTQGMIEDWNAPGEASRLRVTEWEFDN